MEEPPLRTLKFLSQSTDSLHKISKVTESTESLTDEGKSLYLVLESLPILPKDKSQQDCSDWFMCGRYRDDGQSVDGRI